MKGLDSATSKETSLVIDTNDYKKKVEGAAATTSAAVTESSNVAKEITDVNFLSMGMQADATYGKMATDAETAWSRMTTAAENGAQRIVEAFKKIGTVANSIGTANISVTSNIPHNARGTDNFRGGPTYMNEEGGELAVLPRGSTIIPADKSEQIVNNITNIDRSTNKTGDGTGSSVWKNIAALALKGTGDVGAMLTATKAITTKYLPRRERVYKAVLALNLDGKTPPPATKALTLPVLCYGGKNDESAVRCVQTILKGLGYYTGAVDGSFGPLSKQAVCDFQQAKKLPVTYQIDGATWAVLVPLISQYCKGNTVVVKWWQTLLKAAGYYTGAVDGSFGPLTAQGTAAALAAL